jgi:hypothetical protein
MEKRVNILLMVSIAANAAILVLKRYVHNNAFDFVQGIVVGLLFAAVAIKIISVRFPNIAKRLKCQNAD